MKFAFLVSFLFTCFGSHAQNQGNIWCFGDSAGINFNTLSNPQPFSSSLRTRGSCCSIADTSGNLLFYANTRAGVIGNTTIVWNSNNQIMQGGDSIVGQGWYYELIVIPNPSDNKTYYLFSIGVTNSGDEGLYYSVIDMNQNGGLGAVIQKNVMLLNYPSSDGLSAIKHGNGRDWWILFRRGGLPTNEFYFFLITPFGIQGPFVYGIGSISNSNILRTKFSPDGSKLLIINWAGLVELFDFDRCTGSPSNPMTIEPENCCPNYFSAEFSPSGNLIYIGNEELDSCNIVQYNLLAPDIVASKDTIYSFTYPPSYASGGELKIGPDGKIYVANGYYNGVQNFYPYQDSMYNNYNMFISVINSPDSLGSLCNFQPYSFYLGGKRSYLGLPNNPNYDLPADSNSICDTLVNISTNEIQKENGTLDIFYHSGWQTVFLNANSLLGNKYSLSIFEVSGRNVYQVEGNLNSHSISKGLSCSNIANGIYIVSLQTERERLVKRFVKE
jgi:hypothetical protein